MIEEKHPKIRNRRLHLANERTFLAWIRTSISIMAFGFVMERFSLFLDQFSLLLGKGNLGSSSLSHHSNVSSIAGIALIAFGAIIGLLSLIRYKKIERQIDEDTYHPSFVLDFLLALCVVAVGLFFVTYFLQSFNFFSNP
ncbi:MAG: DUF202 domain-containing protein [Syntrophobacterales bacterium]|nr:DUF202 domain-containing protein [Syntrophobacterales bacterium]